LNDLNAKIDSALKVFRVRQKKSESRMTECSIYFVQLGGDITKEMLLSKVEKTLTVDIHLPYEVRRL